MHHIETIKLAGNNRCRSQPRFINTLHQMADQSRLTRTDFAGDDNKPFTLSKAIAKIRQRLPMRRAFEIKLRIGR